MSKYLLTSSKSIREDDSPILNIMLRSKVLAGTRVSEEFTDNKGRTIKINSKELLHKKAFEFYAKTIRKINDLNNREVVIDARELLEDFDDLNNGVNGYKELNKIEKILKPLFEVTIEYVEKEKNAYFHLINSFVYDKIASTVSIDFNKHFVSAYELLWHRHFDMHMYSQIANTKTRSLMRYIESKTCDKYKSCTFKRSEVAELFGKTIDEINDIEDDKKRDNAVFNLNKAIKTSLDELTETVDNNGDKKGVNFIEQYSINKLSSHKFDPIYKITVVKKDQRTVERDIENKVKALEASFGQDENGVNLDAEARKIIADKKINPNSPEVITKQFEGLEL